MMLGGGYPFFSCFNLFPMKKIKKKAKFRKIQENGVFVNLFLRKILITHTPNQSYSNISRIFFAFRDSAKLFLNPKIDLFFIKLLYL